MTKFSGNFAPFFSKYFSPKYFEEKNTKFLKMSSLLLNGVTQ